MLHENKISVSILKVLPAELKLNNMLIAAGPLIMRTGDDTVDKLQTLAICGRFLMVKTAEAVDQHGM